jgi:hypothetical protein
MEIDSIDPPYGISGVKGSMRVPAQGCARSN